MTPEFTRSTEENPRNSRALPTEYRVGHVGDVQVCSSKKVRVLACVKVKITILLHVYFVLIDVGQQLAVWRFFITDCWY